MSYLDEPMDTLETYYEEGEISGDDDENDFEYTTPTKNLKSNNFTRKVSYELVKDDLISELNDVNDENDTYEIPNESDLPISIGDTSKTFKERLLILFRDLGINKENERHYRFNTLHVKGVENMSTEDVYQYFASFAPSHVEWIDNDTCNVVWLDDLSAARVLLSQSKKIINLHGNSLKTVSNDRYTDLNDGIDECVDARDLNIEIPSGVWRFGEPGKKSSTILLRYATRSDKKQSMAAKSGVYSKKFGTVPGLMSKSVRNGTVKLINKVHTPNNIWKTDSIETSMHSSDKPNPWEELAYEWGKIERVKDNDFFELNNKRPLIKANVPDLRISLKQKKENRKRLLNLKTSHSLNEEWESKAKVPRMKMYADDEEKVVKNKQKKTNVQSHGVEDLRSKINRLKSRERINLKVERDNIISQSNTSESENESDDGSSQNWALEQYHTIRESVETKNRKLGLAKYDSDESDLSDDDNYTSQKKNIRQRSPLQIEIDNDEYYQRRSSEK